ncbi:sulfatase family protein [Isoptericola aurantiacus]|uniref:sulfatase family protein n=1 Tax=Isoptericola aurantiacus TaxID=3377839 RepID=UPI00383AEFE7
MDAPPLRPNVLLVVTDQQRFDTLRSYGFSGGHTPHLDRLADDGAVFDAAYCSSPLCTPSRASLFTGKPVTEHGVQRLHDDLDDDERLFPELLREHGYRTGLFGKLHVSSHVREASGRHPHDGFDVYEWCNEASLDMESPLQAYDAWLGEQDPDFRDRLRREGRGVKHHPRELHLSHWIAERAVAFVDEAVRDDVPFFAYLGFFDPHNPYDDHPLELTELIGDLPPVRPEPREVPEGLRRELASKTVDAHIDGDLESARRGYHASVALVDAELGRVLDRIDELGLRDETLVVFTSDHGEMLGDRGLMTKGAFFYEPCVRVPLLLRAPGVVPPGTRVDGPVDLTDVTATVLAAAGADAGAGRPRGGDAAEELDAPRDLRAVAAGTAISRPFVVSSYRNGGVAVGEPTTYFDPPVLATMIRDDRYKLVRYHDGTAPAGQLFDLRVDPEESTDLWRSPDHLDVRERLTAALLDRQVRAEWRRSEEKPAEHRDSRAADGRRGDAA